MTKRYEVIDGKHTDRDGTVYLKGEVIEADGDLTGLFPNKFRLLSEADGRAATKKKKLKLKRKVEDDEETQKAKQVEAERLAKRGVDVTEEFKLPKEAQGLQVHVRDHQAFVYDGDSKKPLNPKGMKKDEVQPFIKNWLEN